MGFLKNYFGCCVENVQEGVEWKVGEDLGVYWGEYGGLNLRGL